MEVRRADYIQVQASLPLRSHIELGVDEYAIQVRIADDLLLDDVAAFGIGVGDLEAEGVGGNEAVGAAEIAGRQQDEIRLDVVLHGSSSQRG